jgi:hypothetical protein
MEGLRARALTNQGSHLVSPVYRIALFWDSITAQDENFFRYEILGSPGCNCQRTKHDRTRAVVGIEEGDLDVTSHANFHEGWCF